MTHHVRAHDQDLQMADTTALETKDLAVEGDRSELRLAGGAFVLRKEATTQAHPTEVQFDIDRVRGATLQRPSGGETGWLHIAVVGGSPPPPTGLAAASDPYTLPLVGRTNGAARRLARMVERHVQVRGVPSDTGATVDHQSTGVVLNPDGPLTPSVGDRSRAPTSDGSVEDDASDDLVARLRELTELHETGALTDDEFERAKARVLDS